VTTVKLPDGWTDGADKYPGKAPLMD